MLTHDAVLDPSTIDNEIAEFFSPLAGFDMEYGNWIGDAEGKDPVKEGWVGRASESGEFTSKGTGGGAKGEETKSVASRERDLSVRDILYGDFPKEKPRSKQVKDVARQLMQRGSTALKALGIESGRIEGPNPETDELLSRVIASEIGDALAQTGSATDWYTHRVAEAMSIASEMYPELASDRHARTAYTAALAVTSQGEVVPSNVRLADQVYRHYRETGRFPTNVQAKERISMNTNFKKLNGLLDAGSPAEMTEFLNQDFTVRELGTLGYEVGGENVNTQVKGSAILGAKIGQGFFQNLNGNYDPVTMDLWFMRGWGRLTGTLQGQLDPGEFTKTRNRFENALRQAGETPADSPPALKERAQEISAQHERDYRKYRAEFDSGERKKSELVLSAQRMVYAMDGINQAPRSGGHREWMRSVINRTREVLAERGTALTNADIQATWWYPEKSLYEKMGSREARDINVDYSDALQDLARKNGISEEAIARAVRAVDRRPGRAAARDQRGGGEDVWAEGDSVAAAQALDLALDRAIAGFFGYDREFKEHEVKRDEEGKFATQASTRSFVSPSVAEGLSLSQARQALGGRRQQVLAQVSQRVDQRLGLREAQSTAVIGAWADGAENSLMTVTSGDPQLIRAAAAIKGAIANQKAVLVFQPGEGEHEMASFAMHGDIADIHNRLLQGGLQFHTLEPTEDGAKVHILVMDDETAAAITDVAGDTEIETVSGNGEFIGTTKDDGTDAEQRADAIRAYREAIDQVAEQRQGQGPDLREIWSDNIDYWRAETAEAADRGIAPDAEFREENVKRDKAGKFAKQTGGGKPSKAAPAATPNLEQQRETGKNFVQHQRMIAAMQAMNRLPEGMRRPADVMLDYGRQFYFDNDSFDCPKGKRHMCYENAGMAAILDPDRTYVEGHVLVNGIPIEHAWNADQNGKVIDPTITDPEPITGYFGLPIETAYLRKTIQRTKVWGMLDPMYNEERLYDDPEDYVKKDIGLPLPKESQEEKEQLDKLLKMWRGGAQDAEFREETGEDIALDAAISGFFARDMSLDAEISGFFGADESDHWKTQPRDKGRFATTGGAGKQAEAKRARVRREDGSLERVSLPDNVIKAAQRLREAPERYFKTEGATMVPVDKLILSRARPEGIINAAKFMEAAYHGEKERRVPIDVRKLEDGSYQVVDGNSTSTVATAAGWEQIPARVVEPATGIVARGSNRVGTTKLNWVGESPIKGKSVEEAVEVAKEAQERLAAVGNRIAGTIRTINPDGTVSEKRNEGGMEGVTFVNPGAKSNIARIKEKLKKYDGEVAMVHDLARGAFLIDDPDKLDEITEKLGEEFGVALEDWRRTPESYFDMQGLLRDKSGIICEMQFMPHEMDAAKNRGELPDGTKTTPGHKLYEKTRDPNVPPQEKSAAVAEQHQLYGTVFRLLPEKWRHRLSAVMGGDRALVAQDWRSPSQIAQWRSPRQDFLQRRPAAAGRQGTSWRPASGTAHG